jgi:Aminopeptidase N
MFPAIIAAETPFSFKDTPGKLPKEVVPAEYSIRVVPNIDKLTFTGTETVKLSVRSPVQKLVLNALELEITEASLDGKMLPTSAIKIDKENELLTLALPSELTLETTHSRLASLGKSISKDRDFLRALSGARQWQEKNTCSVRNSRRLTPAGFSLAGMNRFFARVFN